MFVCLTQTAGLPGSGHTSIPHPRQILGEFFLRVRPAAHTLVGESVRENMPCSRGCFFPFRQLLVYWYPTERRCCGWSPMTTFMIGRDAGQVPRGLLCTRRFGSSFSPLQDDTLAEGDVPRGEGVSDTEWVKDS